MSTTMIFYGPTPLGLIGQPFHAYAERDGRSLGRTSGLPTIEEARRRAEQYWDSYGPDAIVHREESVAQYVEYSIAIWDAEGLFQSRWQLTDVSIGRVAARVAHALEPGDTFAITYAFWLPGGAS